MSTQAIRDAAFLSSLGVNVHLEYTDGKYASSTQVLKDLQYLGINQVRDANLNPANQGQSGYGVLANAGVKFDLIVGAGRTLAASMQSLDAFVAAHPGAVQAVEGPNEVNNWPITYNGLTGDKAVVSFQSALYSTVRSDSLLKGVPVYSATGSYAVVKGFDYTNMHVYPTNGAQPWATLSSQWNTKSSYTGQVPLVLTEAGYSSAATSTGVDYATQAKETLNMIFDAQKLGASKIYLYELLDAYADPTGTTAGKHYGLFNYDGTAKPVATAIHNLTSILADSGASASTFQAGSLNFTLSNMPKTGSSLLLEKSNGAFDLVLWAEPQIWNATSHSAITVAPTQTTIALGATYGEVKVFDPMVGTSPISDLHNVSKVTVGLTDHPLIIEVEPAAASAALHATSTSGLLLL